MSINWKNPYEGAAGEWYKGNLHTHTKIGSGCGQLSMQESLGFYAQAKYDFLAISDHMTLTLAHDHAPELASKFMFIPGIEWNSTNGRGEHTGLYSFDTELLKQCTQISDQGVLLERLRNKPALIIFNHPNWQLTPHYRREDLMARDGYHGVEVYNHVIERLDGYAISSDKWDLLLYRGKRVLGFASDDSHVESDINGGALHVRSPRRDAPAIFEALLRGHFYFASGGMTLGEFGRRGDTVSIHAPQAQELRIIGNGGCVLARTRGTELSLDMTTVNTPYVRCEAYGPGASIAWTQPFFKE